MVNYKKAFYLLCKAFDMREKWENEWEYGCSPECTYFPLSEEMDYAEFSKEEREELNEALKGMQEVSSKMIVYRDNAGDIFDCTKRAIECIDEDDLIKQLKIKFSSFQFTHNLNRFIMHEYCYDERLKEDVYDICFENIKTGKCEAFGWINKNTTKAKMLKNLNAWKKQQDIKNCIVEPFIEAFKEIKGKEVKDGNI